MNKISSNTRSFKPVDMTTGEPWKKILAFTLPMLLSTFNFARHREPQCYGMIVERKGAVIA